MRIKVNRFTLKEVALGDWNICVIYLALNSVAVKMSRRNL